MMKPEEAVRILEANAKIIQSVVDAAERGEIDVECLECRKKDVREFREIAGVIRSLLLELTNLRSVEASHREAVDEYAEDNHRMKTILGALRRCAKTEDIGIPGPDKGAYDIVIRIYDENDDFPLIDSWLRERGSK